MSLYECKQCGAPAEVSGTGIVKSCACEDIGVVANMSATVYGIGHCAGDARKSMRVILAGLLTTLADKLRGSK